MQSSWEGLVKQQLSQFSFSEEEAGELGLTGKKRKILPVGRWDSGFERTLLACRKIHLGSMKFCKGNY